MVKDGYIRVFSFPENVYRITKDDLLEYSQAESIFSITAKAAAKVIDMEEQCVVDAIVDTTREMGLSHLYLIDKTFIIEAIQEKLERMGLDGAQR